MAEQSTEPATLYVTVEESDDYPESLVYELGEGDRRIFAAPDLNRTPAQSLSILKLRSLVGNNVACRDSAGKLFATVTFNGEGDAVLAYYAPDGAIVWSLDVKAEDAVPDSPLPLRRLNHRYRWLAPAFGLFLLVLSAFLNMTTVASAAFITRAAVAFILTVFGAILVLQAVHRHMDL